MANSNPAPSLKGGVYDAEDVIELVQNHENNASIGASEYTGESETESTEMPGALPDSYRNRKF